MASRGCSDRCDLQRTRGRVFFLQNNGNSLCSDSTQNHIVSTSPTITTSSASRRSVALPAHPYAGLFPLAVPPLTAANGNCRAGYGSDPLTGPLGYLGHPGRDKMSWTAGKRLSRRSNRAVFVLGGMSEEEKPVKVLLLTAISTSLRLSTLTDSTSFVRKFFSPDSKGLADR